MSGTNDSPFVMHDDAFRDVLGERPQLQKVVDADAHEGPVYVPGEDALYFSTLPRPTDDPLPGFRTVAIRRLALQGERFFFDLASLCDGIGLPLAAAQETLAALRALEEDA